PHLLGPALRAGPPGGHARAQARDPRPVPRSQLSQQRRVPPDVPAVGEPAVAGEGRGAGAAQAAVSRLTPPLGWSGTALATFRPAAGCASLSQITNAASQRLSAPSTSTTPSVMASRSSGRTGRRSTRCWGLLRYSFTRRWSSAFRRLAMAPSSDPFPPGIAQNAQHL